MSLPTEEEVFKVKNHLDELTKRLVFKVIQVARLGVNASYQDLKDAVYCISIYDSVVHHDEGDPLYFTLCHPRHCEKGLDTKVYTIDIINSKFQSQNPSNGYINCTYCEGDDDTIETCSLRHYCRSCYTTALLNSNPTDPSVASSSNHPVQHHI